MDWKKKTNTENFKKKSVLFLGVDIESSFNPSRNLYILHLNKYLFEFGWKKKYFGVETADVAPGGGACNFPVYALEG